MDETCWMNKFLWIKRFTSIYTYFLFSRYWRHRQYPKTYLNQSLDKAYQFVANEVMNTPIAKDYAIVMETSKQCIAYYLLKSLSNSEGLYLVCSSLEV